MPGLRGPPWPSGCGVHWGLIACCGSIGAEAGVDRERLRWVQPWSTTTPTSTEVFRPAADGPSGHGWIRAGDTEPTTIPEGTCVAFYCAHGGAISDEVGNAIETGAPKPVEVAGLGETVPEPGNSRGPQ